MTTNYSYIGSGPVYLAPVGVPGMTAIGNVSELSLSITEDVKELTDYTRPGGGTYAEVRRITGVELSASLHDISPENLARSVYGEASNLGTTPVTDTLTPSVVGLLYPTSRAIDTSLSVSVTDSDGDPWALGTDYEVRTSGVFIPESNARNLAGLTIDVSYASLAVDVVEALTGSGAEYRLLFDGVNESRSGKPSIVELYRVRIGAASDLALIGEDFGALAVTGKLLPDATRIGDGVSQYFSTRIAE